MPRSMPGQGWVSVRYPPPRSMRPTGVVDDLGADAGQRERGRTRLCGGGPGQRADHDPPGLGLPPGIDDRARAAADVLAVPHPRFRVDRLADGPEELQRRQVVLGRFGCSPLHERSDGGRGRVELGDLVLLDDRPQPVVGREVGHAFVHHAGRAVGQWAVDDVAVPGDPADVGRAPVHVGFGVQVEHVLVGEGDLGEVATGRVHDPLRLARSCRWCTAGTAAARRPSARPGTRDRPPRSDRGTSGHDPPPSRRRCRRDEQRRRARWSASWRSPRRLQASAGRRRRADSRRRR